MIRSVFLVGGYAASPWLFSYVLLLFLFSTPHATSCRQLQERLAPYRIVVSRPDTQTYAHHKIAFRATSANNGCAYTDRKQSQTVRLGSTATTTFPPACPNSCMASSSYERWTRKIQTTLHERRGCASYRVDPSYYRTPSIAFWRG